MARTGCLLRVAFLDDLHDSIDWNGVFAPLRPSKVAPRRHLSRTLACMQSSTGIDRPGDEPGTSNPSVLAPGLLSDVDPDWIPETSDAADTVVDAWTCRKVSALLRERGLDDEVEATRRFVTETIPEYADRFLLELLQNAHDALPPDGSGSVRIELDLEAVPHGVLRVANTGTPFRYRDFRSLCRMAQSEKRPGEGIGYKGVGFKSVLQVAPFPEIYSAAAAGAEDAFRGFRFTFPDEFRYRELLGNAASGIPRMTPYSLPLPIAMDGQDVSIRRLAAEGYATVIQLQLDPLAGEIAKRAVDSILSSSAPVLLFLQRIRDLTIVVYGGGPPREHYLSRHSVAIVAARAERVDKVNLATAGDFLVASAPVDVTKFQAAIEEDVVAHRVDERWLEWTGVPQVSVSVPLGSSPTDDRLYCYLPMEPSAQSPLAGHVDAPFAIGLARRG